MASFSDKCFSLLPTKFIWKYQDSNSTNQKFDRTSTRKLESAFKKNGSDGSLDVKMKGKTYSCSFTTMTWKEDASSSSNRGYRNNRERHITRTPDINSQLQMLMDVEDDKETYLKTHRTTVSPLSIYSFTTHLEPPCTHITTTTTTTSKSLYPNYSQSISSHPHHSFSLNLSTTTCFSITLYSKRKHRLKRYLRNIQRRTMKRISMVILSTWSLFPKH